MAFDDRVTAPLISASHHSLSGCKHGQTPAWTLPQRANAAHLAGITDIGACSDDLGDWAPAELARLIHHRVRVTELEWVDLGEPRDDDAESALFALADLFGSRQLNVGVCGPQTHADSDLARTLKLLARRAADHNLTVAFEPVVFGSVSDLGTVQRIIELAGEPNVGVMLDAYHLARTCWDSLELLWPELVTCIQISGIDHIYPIPAYPHGLFAESQCNRLLPDAGDFPVMDWLGALRSKGVQARLSVEVLSDDLRAMSLFGAADAVASSAASFAAMWEDMS